MWVCFAAASGGASVFGGKAAGNISSASSLLSHQGRKDLANIFKEF